MESLDEQLARLAERGPAAEPRFVVRQAIQIAANDDDAHDQARPRRDVSMRRAAPPATRFDGRRSRSRMVGAAAATLLVVGGAAGVFHLRSGMEAPASERGASTPLNPSLPVPTADPTNGPLLATPVPSDVQPLVSIGRPGWTISGFSGFRPVAAQALTASCPGCGATRLVLTNGNSPLGGALFTAWTLDADYDLEQLAAPVTIGTIPGRATSRGSDTPVAQSRMTIAWPLAPGRTAFVDASGLSDMQVIEMATALTFESSVPVMPARPPGFHQIDTAPAPANTVEVYLQLTDGQRDIELIATNAGLVGLLDWHHVGGHLMFRELQPRMIDGVTVAVDQPPAGEQPIVALDAYWVAGGWGYTAVGHLFGSETEFLDVLRDLDLTDQTSFSASTAGLTLFQLGGFTSPTGWTSEATGS